MLYILTWLEEVGFCTVCSFGAHEVKCLIQIYVSLIILIWLNPRGRKKNSLCYSVRYVFVSSLQLDCCPALQFQLFFFTLICHSNISLNLCVFTTA